MIDIKRLVEDFENTGKSDFDYYNKERTVFLKDDVLFIRGKGEITVDLKELTELRTDLSDTVPVLYDVPSLIIANGVRNIYFKNADVLKCVEFIEIPGSMRTVRNDMFKDFINLKHVVLREGVENIGAGAFFKCESLIRVEVPSTLRLIGEYAFAGCSSLIDININSSISIRRSAFLNCVKLNPLCLTVLINMNRIKSLGFEYMDDGKIDYGKIDYYAEQIRASLGEDVFGESDKDMSASEDMSLFDELENTSGQENTEDDYFDKLDPDMLKQFERLNDDNFGDYFGSGVDDRDDLYQEPDNKDTDNLEINDMDNFFASL